MPPPLTMGNGLSSTSSRRRPGACAHVAPSTSQSPKARGTPLGTPSVPDVQTRVMQSLASRTQEPRWAVSSAESACAAAHSSSMPMTPSAVPGPSPSTVRSVGTSGVIAATSAAMSRPTAWCAVTNTCISAAAPMPASSCRRYWTGKGVTIPPRRATASRTIGSSTQLGSCTPTTTSRRTPCWNSTRERRSTWSPTSAQVQRRGSPWMKVERLGGSIRARRSGCPVRC